MTQHQRRTTKPDEATETPDGESTPNPGVETTEGATDGAQVTDAAPAKKTKTRAQQAREKAAKVREDQDAVALAGAPTFQVTYPAGISLHAPDKDEVEVTMSGGEKVWVDVEGEHVHVPNEARVRASSVQELTDFIRLAGAGLLKQVQDSAI